MHNNILPVILFRTGLSLSVTNVVVVGLALVALIMKNNHQKPLKRYRLVLTSPGNYIAHLEGRRE